jgi:hypothetical protein
MRFIATFRRLASHCRNPLAVRKLRLATGLTIFVYVVLHLVDHALLNISVSAADAMLSLQVWIWQGVLGTIALYFALAAHASLGIWAFYERRHFGWTMRRNGPACAASQHSRAAERPVTPTWSTPICASRARTDWTIGLPRA